MPPLTLKARVFFLVLHLLKIPCDFQEREVPGLVRVGCGIMAIIASVMAFWLPETFGRYELVVL